MKMRIRLNTIFYFILAADLFLYLILFDGANEYLNGNSIAYYMIFSLCILITIAINAKLKNIFLEMLIAVTLVFYHFRIPILLLPGVLTEMDNIPISGNLVNSKMLELCYHYLALSIAIIIFNPKTGKIQCHINKHKANKIMLFVTTIFLFHIISLEFLSNGFGGRSTFMGVFNIIPSILNPYLAMLVLIVYIVSAGKNLCRSHKYWAIAIITIQTGYAYYSGKKAAILLLVLNFLIAKMIYHGPIKVNVKNAIAAIIVVPISIAGHFFGNLMRFYQRDLFGMDVVNNTVQMARNSFNNILHSFSHRIAYFDYYVEKSENDLYLPYISCEYYFKAIVDKMSPGFDVFGVLYSSKMLRYARLGNISGVSNSEQMTLFGEASVIFSFFSIIMFIVMILFFRILIERRPTDDPFVNIFYVAIIFNAYSNWLHGFGFDMFFCIDVAYSILFFFSMVCLCHFSLHKRKEFLIKQLDE